MNPLPPHYRCPACKHSVFLSDTDLFPYEMPLCACPKCRGSMIADGFHLTEHPRHGVHGSEIYVEIPESIRGWAIEDLRTYLKKNGNCLLHLSCANQERNKERDVQRITEYEKKLGTPFSEEGRATILEKYHRRRKRIPQYYQTLFCAMRDEPLYTFGPVTTFKRHTSVGFDFTEWDAASRIYFVTHPELDRLDALMNRVGIPKEKMDYDDLEVLSELAVDFPIPVGISPTSFREWMTLCKSHPQAVSFSHDRGRIYLFALREYRLKWFEIHYPEAWESTAAPERRKND